MMKITATFPGKPLGVYLVEPEDTDYFSELLLSSGAIMVQTKEVV
jgi:hypothetical protein